MATTISHKKKRLVSSLCACIFFAVVFIAGCQYMIKNTIQERSESDSQRMVSSTLTTKKFVANSRPGVNFSKCKPYVQTSSDHQGKPIWIPGYPGSGSELTRTLIEAVTGLHAGSIWESDQCVSNTTVTCKSHWPAVGRRKLDIAEKMKEHYNDGYFLLVRNPKKAIPSFFNYLWEKKSRKRDHTMVAPEEEWNLWRNDNRIRNELKNWKEMFTAWHKLPSYHLAQLVPYEELTDEVKGPQLLQKMNGVILNAGYETIGNDYGRLSCLWRKYVVDAPKVKRQGHVYVPSFTEEQKSMMLSMLDELLTELATEKEVVDLIQSYRDDIKETLRVESATSVVG